MQPDDDPSVFADYPVEPSSESNSYTEILKASALIGASTAVNIGVGIIRTKAMAILLGPAGFGLMGLYGSIVDMTRSVAQLGINSSGVRQIAEAAGSGDMSRIALTATVLRRIALVLGVLGAALLFASSETMSLLTFGSADHTGAIALLSFAVFFRIVSDGQSALIQGMRRIADLARVGILGACFGTVASIALVYWFRENGVVPSLVAVAALSTATSWWYSRKIRVPHPPMALREVRQEAKSLVTLGLAFMASAMLTMAAAYLVRIIVLRHDGLTAAGLYQSAWTLGGLYVGFVLQAMGADFYPRLVAAIQDPHKSNQLVNEQAHVSLLLAGPGVIATLTLAPWVVTLFYSAEFASASDTLRWICLGMALRVITWPMGFIIVAKGVQHLLFLTELAWAVFNVGLAWALVESFGHRGAGIAFFGSYVLHGLMLYPIVRSLNGFRWSSELRKTGLVYLALIGCIFVAFHVFPQRWAITLGVVTMILSTVYSIQTLLRLASPTHIPAALLRVLPLLRCARWS